MVNKGQVNKAQKARLVEKMEAETVELGIKNNNRVQELARLGVQINPIVMLAAQIAVLIERQCPGDYQKARFDLDVQKRLAEELADDKVNPVVDNLRAQAEEFERQKRLAEAGRTEGGLYVPETALSVAEVQVAEEVLAGPLKDDPDEGRSPIRIG